MPSWRDAARSFLLHLQAVRSAKTAVFYRSRVNMLVAWAEARDVPLDHFGKRHLDEYLVARATSGVAETTLHHDALAAKVFLKWCARNDIVSRSLLADYEVRKAPRPHMYMPTPDDMRQLLGSLRTYWEPSHNADARYVAVGKRVFHRERNYATVMLLLDSACRVGEVLSLKLPDYQPSVRQFTVTRSKGREPRAIPVSPECAEALEDWLKVRTRVMRNVPANEDEGWLFISECGTQIEAGRFLKTMKKIVRWAELPAEITLHSLRRFSLNRLAKHNLLAAQTIAGHKDPGTTLLYTKADPDFVRTMHNDVGVVRGILNHTRPERKKRLV